MIARQRKAHKLIWMGLAIAIPILLFFASKNLDFSSVQNPSQEEQLVVKMVGDNVQIELNTPLASPSAVVYELTQDHKAGQVLGQLEGIGEYTFQASKTTKGVLVLDKIKNEELLKIEF